jgi:hypothetical protein
MRPGNTAQKLANLARRNFPLVCLGHVSPASLQRSPAKGDPGTGRGQGRLQKGAGSPNRGGGRIEKGSGRMDWGQGRPEKGRGRMDWGQDRP